jgi:hypothetical protein
MGLQSKSADKLLVLKGKVSEEVTAATVVGTNILATTTYSLPVYDERGTLLGHVALFDTAALT